MAADGTPTRLGLSRGDRAVVLTGAPIAGLVPRGRRVDLARLEAAVDRLVERHEMLRAVFDPDGTQRILPQAPRFHVDVTDADDDGAERALTDLRDRTSHRVPDPARWPLIAVRAVRHGGDRTRLAFSLDYIVLDALSVVTFFWELSRLYRDLDAELPAVDVSFRNYVLDAGPGTEEREAAQRYWSARIGELPPAPELPLRTDPTLVRSPRFVRREMWMPPEQWQAITERARRYELTPATVLLTAYAEVLATWSAGRDLTMNLTLFDRKPVHPDIGNVLGDFTSLMLVEHRSADGPGWLDCARAIQQRVWSGMTHRAVSALWVLREMGRATGDSAVAMPVVFTSALGLDSRIVDMDFPFGQLVWGVGPRCRSCCAPTTRCHCAGCVTSCRTTSRHGRRSSTPSAPAPRRSTTSTAWTTGPTWPRTPSRAPGSTSPSSPRPAWSC
jgi:hypothetical protein